MRRHAKASSAGSILRQAGRLGATSLVTCVAFLAVFASLAAAEPVTIALEGGGAGRVEDPQGVAVDQSTGDVYVADRSNFRLDKFDSEGNFLLAWGAGVADGTSTELQTCGPEASPPTTRCFPGRNTADKTITAERIAVDPASHDVYASENSRRVTRFTPSGAFVFTFGKNVNKTKVGEAGATQGEKDLCTAASGDTCTAGVSGTLPGEFGYPGGLVFDSAGKLWVNDEGKRLQRFEPSGSFLSEVPLPSGTQLSALGIDQSSGDFYVLGPEGNNETQRLNNANNSNSVPFTLSFEGDTTAPIAPDAPSETIEAALEALPSIGHGNVGVTRPFDDARFDPTVVFIHELGGRDLPLMTASGGSPAVTVSPSGDGRPGSVRKLDPSGTLIETLDDAPGDLPRALTVDAAGHLYVGDTGMPYHFIRFSSSGEPESQFGGGQVAASLFGNGGPGGNGLAVDESSGGLYAANNTDNSVKRFSLPEPGPLPEGEHVEDLEPTTVTLAADLNPEGNATTYFFDWGTSESYGETTPTETLAGEEFDAEAVKAQLEELIPDTTYHFRLCATNSAGTVCGADTAFTTLPAIAIDAQWATEVAAHSARLHAELNPLGVAGEWWIEYGTSAGYGSETAKAALPAGFGDVSVGALLTGLEPGTAYHYRFAGTDERDGTVYTVHGSDRMFVTQLSGLGFQLADSRVWEMVTPPDKHGGLIVPLDGAIGGQIQGAEDGEALAYLSMNSVQEDPEGSRTLEETSALSQRGPGGWSSTDLSPPHTEVIPASVGFGVEYKLFSTNLERGLLEPRDATPLSPAASERTPYLRNNTSPPTYVPLVTGCPAEPEPCPAAVEEAANVPAGTEFNHLGPEAGANELIFGHVGVAGASPDLRHVVLGSSVPLAEGISGSAMYEWSAGQLTPVSVKPGGAAVPATLGSGEYSKRHAISDDGSRVFWSGIGLGGLYLRDTELEQTVRLDAVQAGGFGTGQAEPIFQGANPAGTVAFFTDTQNLTEDANESGADLYRCQVTVELGELGCQLTDVTANGAESAEVQGLVLGMSDDGTRVYFAARGVLDTEPNGDGESAVSGRPNLYLWQQGSGVRFIATLDEGDEHDWGGPGSGNTRFPAQNQTAAASPSGLYLAFMSQRSLTDYDNRDAATGELDHEVFRYDASTDELICASCSPSGARPSGVVGGSESFLRYYDWRHIWDGRPVAAVVPEGTNESTADDSSLYRSRYVQDDGRVFFNAVDSLVPADSNGNWDVYEYEPTGTGSCTATSSDAATALTAGGCVSLLSSGTGEAETGFIDASKGGRDVFFFSFAQLSVTDEDHEMDIYDARVDGTPATLERFAECLGEACQPAISPPNDPTPASSGFEGAGNVQPGCPRGKRQVKRHGESHCVARKHRKHKHKRRSARAGNHRGAGR